VVTAEGKVVVVVVVVVTTNGATHPATGIVVAEVSVDGGHNTGALVGVVVVVVPETAVGEMAMNAAARNGRANTERRILDTLLTRNTPKWAPEQRY
jgi:Na+/glutamate symporter